MFVAKKHIPRRTFLRGAGVTLALPLLESMVPALTPLRADRGGAGAALRRHLASAWRVARLLESAAGRQGLRVLVHHQAARAVPQSRRAHHAASTCRRRWRPTDEPGGDHARGAVLLSGARPRRNAVSPYPRRHDRSADRATSTARTRSCRRCSSASRTPATSATATGATAAPTRTRSPGRRRRSRCRRRSIRASSSSACSATARAPRSGCRDRQRNASILDSVTRELGAFKTRSRRRRPGARRHLRREHPRARAAHPDRDGQRGEGADGDVPFGLPREQARALPADVRPDGAGVRGRHHAVGHVHAGPRPERRQLPRVRLQRRLARHVAPRRQAGEHRQLRQGQPLSRAEPRLLLRQAAARFPTATARCWTTC